jgi:hypothetical protein
MIPNWPARRLGRTGATTTVRGGSGPPMVAINFLLCRSPQLTNETPATVWWLHRHSANEFGVR